MTSQARASAAATIESAKRVAESVWTIEHARVCACSAASRPCVVYGCAKAKRALAALAGAAAPPDQAASSAGESGSDDGFSDGDDVAAVRAVLAHREACAWADPARGRGITTDHAHQHHHHVSNLFLRIHIITSRPPPGQPRLLRQPPRAPSPCMT